MSLNRHTQLLGTRGLLGSIQWGASFVGISTARMVGTMEMESPVLTFPHPSCTRYPKISDLGTSGIAIGLASSAGNLDVSESKDERD